MHRWCFIFICESGSVWECFVFSCSFGLSQRMYKVFIHSTLEMFIHSNLEVFIHSILEVFIHSTLEKIVLESSQEAWGSFFLPSCAAETLCVYYYLSRDDLNSCRAHLSSPVQCKLEVAMEYSSISHPSQDSPLSEGLQKNIPVHRVNQQRRAWESALWTLD